jgi:hypothetical protein
LGSRRSRHSKRARAGFFRALAPLLLTLCCAFPARWSALAQAPATIRVTAGAHPNYGRVVLNAPGLPYTVSRDGDHLLIRFPDGATFGELPAAPRNVLAVRVVPGGVELTIPASSVVHVSRMGDKVVVDTDDAASNRTPAPPTRPNEPPKSTSVEVPAGRGERTLDPIPSAPAPIIVAPAAGPPPARPGLPGPAGAVFAPDPHALRIGPPSGLSPSPEKAPERPAVAPDAEREVRQAGQQEGLPPGQPDGPLTAQSEPIQVWPVTHGAPVIGPVALVAIGARPPNGLAGTAIRIPFAAPVGAALFSRGSDSFVVFDERRPIDLAALRDDPVFGSAVVTIYPAATVVRVLRPAGRSAMLSSTRAGWLVSIVSDLPGPKVLTPMVTDGAMTFAAEMPGQVVAISDPGTGGTILVGTQRASGQAVLIERRTPEFIVPVTGQGIVVIPLSDRIGLRITQPGFVLFGARTELALSPSQPMDAATMAAAGLTRLFEFPRQSTETLAQRSRLQAVAAAMSPPLTRGPKRHLLAESLVGLGLGAEAQTLLRVTMKDDPAEAMSPTATGLAGIAALLAGRPAEAADLSDPRLTGTDEVALWRALQTAMTDESSSSAAAVLAIAAPLLFTYPAEMRRRVLPLALETMILGGQAEAAAPLLAQRADDPQLGYARALLEQARGNNDGALKLLDDVANSRSMLDHARAAARAIELRLAMGQLDAKGAADALDARLFDWRGDGRDLALRLRVAELRRKSGDWRAVFTILRGAKTDFPNQSAEIDQQLKDGFAAVPGDRSLDAMAPTELIALLEENAELMAGGPDGEPMRLLLAQKLMALDLPKRADPVLTKLMRAAPLGPGRAGFGATLATMRTHEGDLNGAILALSESNSADMPDAVRERRALIMARVVAERGDTAGAVDFLSGTQTKEADETRAALFEQAKDWPAARDALKLLAARVLPTSGTLDELQLKVALRLATASARAGDDVTLGSLREQLGARIGSTPDADMFRLLTAAPVRGRADLGRARAEMGLARAVTEDIAPRRPAVKTP